MTNNKAALHDSSPYNGNETVLDGNRSFIPITHIGSSSFTLGSRQFKLNNVLYVPSIKKNLISASQFTQDNFVVVTIHLFRQVISNFYYGSLLFQGRCEDHLYPIGPSCQLAFHAISFSLWYSRLGHSSLGSMSQINKAFCKPCALSQSHKLPFNSNTVIAPFPYYLIHSDVWISSTPSNFGFRYYVLFIDDYSRYLWIYPKQARLEVLMHFETLYHMVHNIFNYSINFFQMDSGTEYVNRFLKTFFQPTRIVPHVSCPHTLEQYGLPNASTNIDPLSPVFSKILPTPPLPFRLKPPSLLSLLLIIFLLWFWVG